MSGTDSAAMTAEVIASLTMDEIPMKLRCSVCSMLAVGAVRTPCCDQMICENCEASLDKECPVCLHANLDKDLLKPNKNLRTTIKAFVKKKVMEREVQRKKDEATKIVAIPISTKTPNGTQVDKPSEPVDVPANIPNWNIHTSIDNTANAIAVDPVTGTDSPVQQTPTQAQMDIARPSIENTTDNVQVLTEEVKATTNEETKEGERRDSGVSTQQGQNGEVLAQSGQWPMDGSAGLGMMSSALGLGGMNGALPMDFSQMMQFMPNGMPNTLMGGFPNMMGMPSMGMDPMTMSQMYGGFGGPGMGINGMNMGMGFNAGQEAFGGFNNAWNTGPDNYNANAYGANGMGGNFGAHAGQGGYNMSSHQGNFSQMNQQQYPNNDFHHGYNNHGYQNRGRGRRGYHNAGRGQGGYNAINQGNQNGNANYEPFQYQMPSQSSQQIASQHANEDQQQAQDGDGFSARAPLPAEYTEAANKAQADEDQVNQSLNPGGENDEVAVDAQVSNGDLHATADTETKELGPEPEPEPAGESSKVNDEHIKENGESGKPEEDKPLPIQTFISSDDARTGKPQLQHSQLSDLSMPPPAGPAGPTIPLGPAARYPTDQSQDHAGWGRGMGRGYFAGGARGRGEYRGRGAGYTNGIHTSPTTVSLASSTLPIQPKGLGVEGAPTGPKALREGLPNTGIRGGRGFSIVGRAYAARSEVRTRSKSRTSSRNHSRSRSPEPSRPRSSHHRSHRHRSNSAPDEEERSKDKERRRRRSHKNEDEDVEEESVDPEEPQKQATSRESSSRKSTHRSRRRRHDKDSSTSHHRYHRDRSRDRDRDEDRKHRRKRSRSPTSASVVPTPTSANAPSFPDTEDKDSSGSRKRRDRDRDREDDNHHNDRKRSRRDRTTSPPPQLQDGSWASTHGKGRERGDARETHNHAESRQSSTINDNHVDEAVAAAPVKPIPTGPKQAEKDHHTLEREARNRERLMKEMQRRAATEGGAPKRKGPAVEPKVAGRRVSYKYEDEESEEARTIRVEHEREAARWD